MELISHFLVVTRHFQFGIEKPHEGCQTGYDDCVATSMRAPQADSIPCVLVSARVSSVLNRDVRHFGKKFMFDGDEETCWNSDQVKASATLIVPQIFMTHL